MNIKESLTFGMHELQKLEFPLFESEVLLAQVLDQSRAFLKMFPLTLLDDDEERLYREFIQKRSKNIPTAYISGVKQWGDFEIKVNERVLIPRDETEVLCEKIIEEARLPQRILDVGTGSGILALFLKNKYRDAQVVALDISPDALEVARTNADEYGLAIDFRESDMLSALPDGDSWDLIVANLPYVPTKMKISEDVRKEPVQALFSGDDGLDHIRRLALDIDEKNIQFQELWLEFLPKQKKEIEQIFRSKKVSFFKDIGGDVFFAKIFLV